MINLCNKTSSILRRVKCSRNYCKAMASELDANGELIDAVRSIVPLLTQDRHKGQCGRVGIIGGSIEYTGAPYFAAISALKVGCDLVHVFCRKEAAPVIKSYSPELIVHPYLDDPEASDMIKPWLERLHVIVIGPGLGREPQVLESVAGVINFCRNSPSSKPLVIDADGIFLVTEKPEVIKNYPGGVILTPNIVEFSRILKAILNKCMELNNSQPNAKCVQELAHNLGSEVTVVLKGPFDVIANSEHVVFCIEGGSPRRCGGQGDLLSGSIATFYAWALNAEVRKVHSWSPAIIAAYGGCRLARECSKRAFSKNGRSALTTDMIEEISASFGFLYEPK